MHLAYDDAGTGEPAVVLVHGWGFGNPSALVPQFEHLAIRRRVLKLDLPGHGRSDRPDLKSRVLTELSQVAPDLAASIMHEGMATDGSDSLAQVRCPLLVVSARAPVDMDRLRELQPEALVGNVIGSGHWLTLAVPDQGNAMLDRFLELVATRR